MIGDNSWDIIKQNKEEERNHEDNKGKEKRYKELKLWCKSNFHELHFHIYIYIWKLMSDIILTMYIQKSNAFKIKFFLFGLTNNLHLFQIFFLLMKYNDIQTSIVKSKIIK